MKKITRMIPISTVTVAEFGIENETPVIKNKYDLRFIGEDLRDYAARNVKKGEVTNDAE